MNDQVQVELISSAGQTLFWPAPNGSDYAAAQAAYAADKDRVAKLKPALPAPPAGQEWYERLPPSGNPATELDVEAPNAEFIP